MELPSAKSQSYSLNDLNHSTSDLLPYRCPACGNGKRFRSLIALRLHTSIVHDISQPNNRFSSTEKLSSGQNMSEIDKPSSLDVFVASSPSNNERDLSANFSNLISSTAIDDMFNKYSTRIDEVADRFDSQSKKLENKLKLTKQLEEIRKQKEQLNKLKKAWKAAHGVSQLVHDTDVVINKHLSNDLEKFQSEKPKWKSNENQMAEKVDYKIDSAQQEQHSMDKQLDISIKLAAQYKALALDTERKLKEKIEEERHLKGYIEVTAAKEQEAKAKLAEFMESLLQRTEYAESMLQAYQNKAGSPGGNNLFQPVQADRSQPLFHPKREKGRSDFRANGLMTSHAGVSSRLNDSGISLLRDSHSYDQPDNHRFPTSRYTEISEEKPLRFNQAKSRNGFRLSPFSNLSDDGENSTRAADRRVALFCVFTRLRSVDLVRCALVCREWKDTSRHSQLWSRIRIHDVNINPKLLHLVALWSKETCSLCLKNVGLLSPENATGAGVFEEGLEMILKACAGRLMVFSIDRCDPFVTSRSLWLVSCYNKNICSISYRSSLDPVSHQVAWALGSSCRNLVSLEVAPLQPCSVRGLFTNNVARMLSWCWPQLQALSFGGLDIDGAGLLAVALNCHHLKVLELDHARGVSNDQAMTVCKHGLKELHTLLFTHTPVLPSTLLHFLKTLNIRSVYVIVSQRDYLTRSKYKKISGDYKKIARTFVNMAQSQAYRGVLSVECQ